MFDVFILIVLIVTKDFDCRLIYIYVERSSKSFDVAWLDVWEMFCKIFSQVYVKTIVGPSKFVFDPWKSANQVDQMSIKF